MSASPTVFLSGVIVGRTVLIGAPFPATSVVSELALVLPCAFVAVTMTDTRFDASAEVSV